MGGGGGGGYINQSLNFVKYTLPHENNSIMHNKINVGYDKTCLIW